MSFDIDALLAHEFEPIAFSYTERDVSLYALGVGAPADPLDQDELKFVYELSSHGFVVLPGFAALFPGKMIDVLLTGRLPGGLTYNPMMLVHGEQVIALDRPLPTRATITARPRVSAVYDKGSGAVVVTDVPCYDESGQRVAFNQMSMFIRGIGGWGGDRGPSTGDAYQPPPREPDAVMTEATSPKQALIYRLSGDINPLHADPAMAALGGFDRPILHGLATFGFATRAVIKHMGGNDPARFRRVRVRFANPVFPGETLRTEMWRTEAGVIFRTTVVERDAIALTQALAEVD
ncbi:MAG: MaoC/PaaZ C-terminal domain-containing protein [Candidatus Flexifilum sp.]|jgi:3-hydroxyacyl-CoA dehydrogenase/3a,7a,12a-trihydroxy-5b-cholest-24-enoyl-CoA hydratase